MRLFFAGILRSESLRWNLASNLIGRAWQGAISLLSLPVYLALLGPEAFGIVSLVQILNALCTVLDFGVTATATREISVLRSPGGKRRAANLLHTFEGLNWTFAILIAMVIAVLAGWISHHWVSAQSLSMSDISAAITLGGLTLAARWPVALYSGVLRGLERQVLLNAVLMATAAFRVIVTITVLILIFPTIHSFLILQILINLLEAFVLRFIALSLVDPNRIGRFDTAELRRNWRFAISFNLVGALGVIISSTDRLMISTFLPITALTDYSVCATATGAMQVMYLAVATATFPRMSILWRNRNTAELTLLYRTTLRLTVYWCLGPVVLFCFFPMDILGLWTQSPETSMSGAPVLPIMALSLLMNCASSPAYNILIASGRTRVPLLVNASSAPVMLIACYLLVHAYGLLGAAVCGLVSNFACFLIYGMYSRTHILCSPTSIRTYNLGFPVALLVPAIGVGIFGRCALQSSASGSATGAVLFFTALSFYVCGVPFLTREERQLIFRPFEATHLLRLPLHGKAT